MKDPAVNRWYKDLEENVIFEVVAVDEYGQTVEIQYIDGELAEYDFDSWQELALEQVEEPEDWRNAYELDREDSASTDEVIHPEAWLNPLSSIESDVVNGLVDDTEL